MRFKKELVFIIGISLLLGLIALVIADMPISSCRIIYQPGNYELIQDINGDILSNNCITIISPDISINCKGFKISSNKNFAGIYSTQPNTTIKNCNIQMGNTDYYGYGIHLYGVNQAYIFNNTLNSQSTGLKAVNSDNLIIEDNVLNDNLDKGIHFYQVKNSKINSNSISNYEGIIISFGSNIILSDNLIKNNYRGILLDHSQDNLFIDNSVLNNYYGLHIFDSYNNLFKNSNLEQNNKDVYFQLYDPYGGILLFKNNTFLNCNYKSEIVNIGYQFERSWYYGAKILDTLNTPISNANVAIYDESNSLVKSMTTDSQGNTEIINLIQYDNTNNVTTYKEKYNITVSKDNFTTSKTYSATQSNLNDLIILDITKPEPVKPILKVISPIQGNVYKSIYVPFNLKANKPVKFYYKYEVGNLKSKWIQLNKDYSESFNKEVKITKLGAVKITFKAVDENGKSDQISRKFFVLNIKNEDKNKKIESENKNAFPNTNYLMKKAYV